MNNDLNSLGNLLIEINSNLTKLLQSQQINNFLALANNPNVPEDVRSNSLNRAMDLMGIQKQNNVENDISALVR